MGENGVCIFCRNVVGLRKRTRLLLKHTILVSGTFIVCPGTGCYATPLSTDAVDPHAASTGTPTTRED